MVSGEVAAGEVAAGEVSGEVAAGVVAGVDVAATAVVAGTWAIRQRYPGTTKEQNLIGNGAYVLHLAFDCYICSTLVITM